MFGVGHPHIKPESLKIVAIAAVPPLIAKPRWVYGAATRKTKSGMWSGRCVLSTRPVTMKKLRKVRIEHGVCLERAMEKAVVEPK
jgi:hypothetical protein